MATAPRVTLEQHDAPVVLKFDQSSGKTEAVRGELDPPAKRSIGHFLREEVVQSKRQKGSEVEATSDRVRMLRELQEMALEGAQKASQVASLLGDPWGDQQVRFLQLHPFTPKKMDWDQVSRSLEETMNAVPGRIEGILEARNRLTPALPELLAQMEAAIGFLGHRWPIHSSLGHHAVELARPETVADMMPRALVRVSNNPKRGVTLSFPWEISLLVQPRKELFVSLRSQTLGEGSSQSSANSSLAGLGEMLRPEALHEALFGAQRLLVDASIFEGLRKGLSKTDCKAQWTLRRAASNEIAFMVVLDVDVVEVVLGLRKEPEMQSSPADLETGAQLWDFLADSAHLQLRDAHRPGRATHVDNETPEPGEEPKEAEPEPDQLACFQSWLHPRLEAVTQYLSRQNAVFFCGRPAISHACALTSALSRANHCES
ncbi:unnamed protein product [Durusdinium trenchii]|uniref:Mediator of RNA polymerase II transcription subunit 17 n=1 Tax=Durusdinium trenchii TaxID=1381693 RepID=A0ABP0P214_9DINO